MNKMIAVFFNMGRTDGMIFDVMNFEFFQLIVFQSL